MTPVFATVFEVISILGAAAAALASAFITLLKARARSHLSEELSKYHNLIRDYESASTEEKQKKIAALSKQLSLIVSALPKNERGAAASALEQPSESGRSRYTEQVADDALRLEQEKSATDSARS